MPAIDELTGIRLTAAEPGRVVFAMAAHPWLSNEWGTVYGDVRVAVATGTTALTPA